MKLLVAAALAWAAAPSDSAAVPVVPAASTVVVKRIVIKPKPSSSHGPPPNVRLTIEAPTPRGPWTMRVSNLDERPVRIAADARLLTLEITPRSARKAIHCELPADMRPTDELESALVLPPGRSYAESFEPLLFCFGLPKVEALSPGAMVVAHLGWLGTSASSPPFVVSPVDGVVPELAPVKSMESPPIGLPDEPARKANAAFPTPPIAVAPFADIPRLTLAGAPAVDAVALEALEIPVSLTNDGVHTVILRFRPETLAFDVVGPNGMQYCVWPTMPGAPIREIFTTLPPKGSASLNAVLFSYCASSLFEQGGLFVVRPTLDTRLASGASVGLRTFDGEIVAGTPTLVRLHRGILPPPLRRPRLEPAEASVPSPP